MRWFVSFAQAVGDGQASQDMFITLSWDTVRIHGIQPTFFFTPVRSERFRPTDLASLFLASYLPSNPRIRHGSALNHMRSDWRTRIGLRSSSMIAEAASSESVVGATESQPKQRVPGPFTANLPAPEDLSDKVMLSIVTQEMSDDDVNSLAWKYLGYQFDEDAGKWDTSGVFPKWAVKFPEPPDLVGVTRTYSREVDAPVLRAVQALQKSVPTEHKDNLRAFLAPLGWNGFKMEGLTPNMTRRAQVAQWLYYYRQALHGVPLEELQRRRDARSATERSREDSGEKVPPTGTTRQGVL